MKRYKDVLINTFDELVEAFKKFGFKVEIVEEKFDRVFYEEYKRNDEFIISPYKSCKFEGHKVVGFFAEKTICSFINGRINGRIAADHKKCFDKMSKCPLCVKYPVSEKRLFEGLRLLGSTKGYKISNSYGYLDCNPFPYNKFD